MVKSEKQSSERLYKRSMGVRGMHKAKAQLIRCEVCGRLIDEEFAIALWCNRLGEERWARTGFVCSVECEEKACNGCIFRSTCTIAQRGGDER